MKIERVQRCLKLLLPDGHLWWDKANGGDLETTVNGYAWEFKRILDSAQSLVYFFLPYVTAWIPELEFMLGLPDEDLTDTERRGRVDGRMNLLFKDKGRLALYENTMHTATFTEVVVRTLGSNGSPESPYDFFPESGATFFGNLETEYGDIDSIFNNSGVVGDALLLTNGGSLKFFEDPDNAITELEINPAYWPFYLVVEGPAGAQLEIPKRQQQTFFDLIYGWKPGDMHVIIKVKFIEE